MIKEDEILEYIFLLFYMQIYMLHPKGFCSNPCIKKTWVFLSIIFYLFMDPKEIYFKFTFASENAYRKTRVPPLRL